jgi:hypothetical protein
MQTATIYSRRPGHFRRRDRGIPSEPGKKFHNYLNVREGANWRLAGVWPADQCLHASSSHFDILEAPAAGSAFNRGSVHLPVLSGAAAETSKVA